MFSWQIATSRGLDTATPRPNQSACKFNWDVFVISRINKMDIEDMVKFYQQKPKTTDLPLRSSLCAAVRSPQEKLQKGVCVMLLLILLLAQIIHP